MLNLFKYQAWHIDNRLFLRLLYVLINELMFFIKKHLRSSSIHRPQIVEVYKAHIPNPILDTANIKGVVKRYPPFFMYVILRIAFYEIYTFKNIVNPAQNDIFDKSHIKLV